MGNATRAFPQVNPLGFSTVLRIGILTCRVPLGSVPNPTGSQEDLDMSQEATREQHESQKPRENENLNRTPGKDSQENNRNPGQDRNNPSNNQLGIRSAARIAAELLRSTEINQITPETLAIDRVDQRSSRTTRIARTAILPRRVTKSPMAKSCAVPKRKTGPSNKARRQDLSLVRGPGWRNGPTICSESVKYRKNSMGLAAETYYP
jgi:hypothetical protein